TAVCANGVPFVWNGISIPGAGAYPFTTLSAAGCDSTTTLNVSIIPLINVSIDTAVCANGVPFVWNGISIPGAGAYPFTTLSTAGCDSTTTLNVTINPLPVVNAGTYPAVCINGSAITLSGTPAGGTFSGPGVTGNLFNPTVAGSGNHIVTYSYTNSNGCSNTATVTITVNPLPVVNAGTYPAICRNGGSITLSGTPAGGSFSGPGVTGNIFNPVTAGAGIHTITYSAGVGCSNTATTTITVNAEPTLIITNPAGVCAGSTVDLTSTNITAGSDPGLTLGYWTNAAGTIALTNPNAVSTSGTYYISAVNSNGCRSIAPVIVTIYPVLTASLTGGGTICAGSGKTLTITFAGTSPFAFTYTDGTNAITTNGINSASYQFTVNPALTTTYTLTSISDANCTNTANSSSVIITVEPLLAPMRYTSVTASANVPMQLIARNLGNSYSYNWAPAVGLNTYVVYNPIFNYNNQTEYTIAITSPAGCKVVDTLLVRLPVQSPVINIDIFVPKAWSPNGDGHNDQLRPLTLNIREIRYFRIFNRWGELVFETNVMGQGWDGIYKGKPGVMDTYTWTAEAIGTDGKIIRRSGNSVLLR
ncbi:MAG: T9SS type B sorting domain-containing protein, partial [Chitinophagaceae bacterium]